MRWAGEGDMGSILQGEAMDRWGDQLYGLDWGDQMGWGGRGGEYT